MLVHNISGHLQKSVYPPIIKLKYGKYTHYECHKANSPYPQIRHRKRSSILANQENTPDNPEKVNHGKDKNIQRGNKIHFYRPKNKGYKNHKEKSRSD